MKTDWVAIFDWDGVVIDSSGQHERSWEMLAAELGLPLPPDHFRRGFGRKNQVIIPEILGWTHDPVRIQAMGDRKEELYRELVLSEGSNVLPGSREFLHALRERGIPTAVGSSTPRANLDMHFEVTGLGGLFDAVISGDDVSHGKPDPEVFLKAAAALGAEPARCVVFEDALAGLVAARRGGMKAIGIATTHPASDLTLADFTAPHLGEVDLQRLEALF
ncbi:MAG: HAD family hydrolase [Terrimicrobiaceae bacterium]